MEVILIQDVDKLGKKGEQKSVKNGYARNYLIPGGLAVYATPAMQRQVKDQVEAQEKRRVKKLEELKGTVDEIAKVEVKISAKVGEKGQLYGSVTPAQISDALRKQAMMDIDKSKLSLDEPIKAAGGYSVKVDLGEGLESKFQLTVEGTIDG